MIEIIIGLIGLLVGGGIIFAVVHFRNSKKVNEKIAHRLINRDYQKKKQFNWLWRFCKYFMEK